MAIGRLHISHSNQNDTFTIFPNDIIGACMTNQRNVPPILVSSRLESEALQVTSVNNDCIDEDLQSLDFATLNTEIQNSLNVEAIISKYSRCIVLI